MLKGLTGSNFTPGIGSFVVFGVGIQRKSRKAGAPGPPQRLTRSRSEPGLPHWQISTAGKRSPLDCPGALPRERWWPSEPITTKSSPARSAGNDEFEPEARGRIRVEEWSGHKLSRSAVWGLCSVSPSNVIWSTGSVTTGDWSRVTGRTSKPS